MQGGGGGRTQLIFMRPVRDSTSFLVTITFPTRSMHGVSGFSSWRNTHHCYIESSRGVAAELVYSLRNASYTYEAIEPLKVYTEYPVYITIMF